MSPSRAPAAAPWRPAAGRVARRAGAWRGRAVRGARRASSAPTPTMTAMPAGHSKTASILVIPLPPLPERRNLYLSSYPGMEPAYQDDPERPVRGAGNRRLRAGRIASASRAWPSGRDRTCPALPRAAARRGTAIAQAASSAQPASHAGHDPAAPPPRRKRSASGTAPKLARHSAHAINVPRPNGCSRTDRATWASGMRLATPDRRGPADGGAGDPVARDQQQVQASRSPPPPAARSSGSSCCVRW